MDVVLPGSNGIFPVFSFSDVFLLGFFKYFLRASLSPSEKKDEEGPTRPVLRRMASLPESFWPVAALMRLL